MFARQASHRRSRKTVKIHELHHCQAFEFQISSAQPRRCGALHELYFRMESLDRIRGESNGFADDEGSERCVWTPRRPPSMIHFSRLRPEPMLQSVAISKKRLCREFINFRPCFATYLMRVRFWCNSFSLATARLRRRPIERAFVPFMIF